MKKTVFLAIACLLSLQTYAMQGPIKSENQASLIHSENLLEQQLSDAKKIAKEAGKKILEIRSSGQLVSTDVVLLNGKKVRQTNADIEASEYIYHELSERYPSYGFLSQDQMDKDPNWHMKDSIWIVNSIDGTKKFEKGQDDFHVQIGLLQGNESVLGVSYYPATDSYVWAVKGQGAWLQQTEVKQKLIAKPIAEKILITSTHHPFIEPFLAKWDWIPGKTSSDLCSTTRLLKMIRGEASLYISLGASAHGIEKKGAVWNYGANVVIANEAGLILTTLTGQPINLREPTALLVEGVILTTDPTVHSKIVESHLHLE